MIMRIILIGIAVLMGAAIGVIGVQRWQGSGSQPFGAPFTLVDGKNQPITEAAFRGHPSAVFFGFTHCPEVCPTTLAEMDGWLKELGDEGKAVRAYFVSVDPERDTPEIMDAYVSNVSDRITPITGQPNEIASVVKSFGIYARKVPLEGGDYTMDHTASVLLLGADGDFEGTIAYGENGASAVAKLKRLATEG